ncbi:hypothetical protein AALO_G00253920 [Alosa alosa]|uniref:Uncharacterized protein n=1 Tax=Alosa alosa TaxID=278164 RepID=A0AAV6FRQ7_9TELE|nr:hypothetical protein AALO_G00253920 [Alosa alosa]
MASRPALSFLLAVLACTGPAHPSPPLLLRPRERERDSGGVSGGVNIAVVHSGSSLLLDAGGGGGSGRGVRGGVGGAGGVGGGGGGLGRGGMAGLGRHGGRQRGDPLGLGQRHLADGEREQPRQPAAAAVRPAGHHAAAGPGVRAGASASARPSPAGTHARVRLGADRRAHRGRGRRGGARQRTPGEWLHLLAVHVLHCPAAGGHLRGAGGITTGPGLLGGVHGADSRGISLDMVEGITDGSFIGWDKKSVVMLNLTGDPGGVHTRRMLKESEAQVRLLYCSQEEAEFVFRAAWATGQATPSHLWFAVGPALSGLGMEGLPKALLAVRPQGWRDEPRRRISKGVSVLTHGAMALRREYGSQRWTAATTALQHRAGTERRKDTGQDWACLNMIPSSAHALLPLHRCVCSTAPRRRPSLSSGLGVDPEPAPPCHLWFAVGPALSGLGMEA